MKNKFKILSIFAVIAIIFIGVDLKEVKALEQISIRDNAYLCTVEKDTCEVYYESPSQDGTITTKYKINGSGPNAVDSGSRTIKIDPKTLTIGLNAIEIYEENDKNETSNTITVYLIAVNESKTLNNESDNDLKANIILDNAPIDTKFSIKKVTDKNIINKLGTNYVYHFQLFSGSTSMADIYKNYSGAWGMTGSGTVSQFDIEVPNELKGKISGGDWNVFFAKSDLSEDTAFFGFSEENGYIVVNPMWHTNILDGYMYFTTSSGRDMGNVANAGSKKISVPNTALNKSIIIIVAAIILVGVGSIIIYKVTKDKKQNIK